MSRQIANIYDPNPISPLALIMENLSILTSGKWEHYKIKYYEGLPRSSPMMVEMVALAGLPNIPGNGTIAKSLLAILQPAENEFYHLRWEPIDDMEGILWEQSSQGRLAGRSVQARVTVFTGQRDPYLATTTFFILGMNRDMNLEVRNPSPIAQPQARFVFFGYRYLLNLVDSTTKAGIEAGRIASTYVPAEGLA